MPNRLKSRKFWIAIGTVFSIAIAELTGVEIDPAAIAGIVLVVATYVVGQGIVDQGAFQVASASVYAASEVGKLQLEVYVRNLETQLADLVNKLPEEDEE